MKRARPGKKSWYRPPYPLILCKDHPGDPLPGYVVCEHLLRPPWPDAAYIERADKQDLGVAVCAECLARGELDADNMITACAHSVRERFGVPL